LLKRLGRDKHFNLLRSLGLGYYRIIVGQRVELRVLTDRQTDRQNDVFEGLKL
jgi:hypothetical protein